MNNVFLNREQDQSTPINLPTPVVTVPQVTASTYRIVEAIDNHQTKTVTVRVILGNPNVGTTMRHLVVWRGEEYDKAGQWTDTDLINAVTPLVMASFTSSN